MADHYRLQQPFGLILAGGQSRRMGGGQKVLMRLGDGTVLDEVMSRLEPQVQELGLSVHGDQPELSRRGLMLLPDVSPEHLGPLAGVQAGLRWITERGADWLVTVAGDTPFLPPDLVPRLLDAALDAQVPASLASDDDGLHPTAALWHRALLATVEQALAQDDLRLKDALFAAGAKVVPFPKAGAFFNINTPDDLAKARAYIPKA